MQEAIKNMLSSKKALATIAGVLVIALAPRLGLNPEQITAILALIGTYVIGQGVADHGKEQVKAANGHKATEK